VVVHDFDLVGAIVLPNKTDAPLVVDPDPVLPPAVALERFELVPERDPQTGQIAGSMQLQELAPRHALNVPEPGHGLAAENRLGIDAQELVDH